MKCVLSAIRSIKRLHEHASISVETAVLLPFVFLIFFIFVSFFQYIAAYLNVYQAADITAKYMSYYSCIYYREGIERINDSIVSKLYSELGEDGLIVSDMINTFSGNMACSQIASAVFSEQIKNNADLYINNFYKLDNISLAGSSFFEDNNRFNLQITCSVDTFFPLPEFFGKGYFISINIKGNGWLGGSYFIKDSEPSVWKLNNFDRGKAIEQHLGCNLPEDYPIIDIYDKSSGTVTIVRSLNHTTKSYLNVNNLKKVLDESLEKIKNFNGTEHSTFADSSLVIKSSDIKKRKFILVVPTNDMTKMQTKTILEFSAQCALSNVEFVLERYHVSY
ncbi:MAG: hypothetical protein IJZ94_02175 [Clostridia bacterium]|nr:hypothetical protein [Clostridia bacterium]